MPGMRVPAATRTPGVVQPVGNFAILKYLVDPNFTNINRPALAQTFEEIATNGRFTIVVNHLKSKGCRDARTFEPHVTQLPAGTPGARTWQEVWVAVCANGRYPVRIDFRESGLDAANWVIR